jgi:hypothetical protein
VKQYFKQQFEENRKATEEIIYGFDNKTYHSGREIKVGDTVLFGLVETSHNQESNEISMSLIMLHEDDLDQYELSDRYHPNQFVPLLKFKENG